jgi:tetratricopeptide (TPR) repeat protein
VGEAEVTGSLAGILMGIGNLDRARYFAERALQLDREVGDRMEEGFLHGTLAQLSVWQGRFEESRAHVEEAILCARETDTLLIEAWVHLTRVILLDALGDYRQADTVNDTYKTLETQWDPIRHHVYHWVLRGLVAYHRGNYQAAMKSAEQALAIIADAGDYRSQGWLPWMWACALVVRAHTHAAMGDLEAAFNDHREALATQIIAGASAVTNDARAGLARVAMRQGDLKVAMTQVEAILDFLESRALDGAMEPLRVLLTCYRVLDAADDLRADGILETAHSLLMERAGTIQDETLRLSYLDNVEAHREIRYAWSGRDT